jgi:AcrR family transcriptional regulator
VTPQESSVKPLDARVVRTRHDVVRAAIEILISDGLDALTHPNVARRAGYSKATVYAHWPDRIDLIRDAFARLGDVPHHVPTGNLRTDLIGELQGFRSAMEIHHLDRVLAVLAEASTAMPELAPIQERFVADGERPIRKLLSPHLRGARLEAAVFLLCGTVVHPALMHGRPPTNAVIAHAVDAALTLVDTPTT